MKTALLGWGSLLWEGGTDFDKWHDEWRFDGPRLPIEFSRISKTRLGALTLVIDPKHGAPTIVAWCISRRAQPEDAICDLRCREGTNPGNIGRFFSKNSPAPASASSLNEAPEVSIGAWANEKKLDAVIWTSLESNFTEKARAPFSIAEVISYVKRLPPEGKVKAAEYVWRAPEFVHTPVRQALQQAPWFT